MCIFAKTILASAQSQQNDPGMSRSSRMPAIISVAYWNLKISFRASVRSSMYALSSLSKSQLVCLIKIFKYPYILDFLSFESVILTPLLG